MVPFAFRCSAGPLLSHSDLILFYFTCFWLVPAPICFDISCPPTSFWTSHCQQWAWMRRRMRRRRKAAHSDSWQQHEIPSWGCLWAHEEDYPSLYPLIWGAIWSFMFSKLMRSACSCLSCFIAFVLSINMPPAVQQLWRLNSPPCMRNWCSRQLQVTQQIQLRIIN